MSVLDHPVDILVLNKTKVKVVIILYLHHGLETDLISFAFSAPKLQICKFRFSFVLRFSFSALQFRFRSVFGPLSFSAQSEAERRLRLLQTTNRPEYFVYNR